MTMSMEVLLWEGLAGLRQARHTGRQLQGIARAREERQGPAKVCRPGGGARGRL